MGSDHVISTSGVCASVEVTGGNNTVSAEIAPKGKLEVGGADHKITWKSSGEPTQDISGGQHNINRQK